MSYYYETEQIFDSNGDHVGDRAKISLDSGIEYFLDSTDDTLGEYHSKMIQDFQDKDELDRFAQMLIENHNTAFLRWHDL